MVVKIDQEISDNMMSESIINTREEDIEVVTSMIVDTTEVIEVVTTTIGIGDSDKVPALPMNQDRIQGPTANNISSVADKMEAEATVDLEVVDIVTIVATTSNLPLAVIRCRILAEHQLDTEAEAVANEN